MSDAKKRANYGFPALRAFIQGYARSDVPDQRAVQDFMECETTEVVKPLQGELLLVLDGKYDREIFDKAIGVKRRAKYESYENWARLMLQWIANYKG